MVRVSEPEVVELQVKKRVLGRRPSALTKRSGLPNWALTVIDRSSCPGDVQIW